MPNLRTLVLEGSVTDAELTHLSGLTALKSLKLEDCSQITNTGLASLNQLTTLEKLHLYECSQITHLNLGNLIELQNLRFDIDRRITQFTLEIFTALECLIIHNYSLINLSDIQLPQFSTLTQLKELEFYRAINNTLLTQLKSLTGLKSLDLSYCAQITDIGLKNLSGFTVLHTLNLTNCSITGIGFQHISHLALQTLDLTETQINDVGLSILKSFNSLHTLCLSACLKITDSGLINLGHLTLNTLSLARCSQITDIGLYHLKGLAASLESLDLAESGATDASLSHLKTFTRLRRLNLHLCVQITNAGLIHLQALTTLRALLLNKCPKIDDAGILNLSTHTTLRFLSLSQCPVTGSGLRSLQDHLPTLRLLPAPPPKAPDHLNDTIVP